MNKGELTKTIAKKYDISQRLSGDIVDSVFTEIQKSVKKGSEVRIVGFGTFYRAKRKARMGINPQTGSKMRIPERKVPKFRAGADFKKAVK